jgi:plastocyanin
VTNVSTAGSYESKGTAKVNRDGTLTGTFKDSNDVTGTFTATLVKPGPDRAPSSGTVTVTEGTDGEKQYTPEEIYVTSGTTVRFCDVSPLGEAPYILGLKHWPDGTHNGKPDQDAGAWQLRRGDCESLTPTVSSPHVYDVADGVHPRAAAYLIVTP